MRAGEEAAGSLRVALAKKSRRPERRSIIEDSIGGIPRYSGEEGLKSHSEPPRLACQPPNVLGTIGRACLPQDSGIQSATLFLLPLPRAAEFSRHERGRIRDCRSVLPHLIRSRISPSGRPLQ